MSSILQGADKAYLREYNESEDERRLDALQDSIGSIRKATKGGKYLGSDVIDIMVQVQGFAEKLGIDPKELDYAENQVREAQNNLESAIYGLEEPFEDAIRTLQNRIDDVRMDAEDLDEVKYIDGFMGADGKLTSKPTAKDYASNKEFQDMKKKLGDRMPQPTKRDKDGKLSPFKKDDLDEAGTNCWKGYKKKGTKKMFGKTVNNCVKATESEEVDEGMYDQDAFDAIFKDKREQAKKSKTTPKDTGMYNNSTPTKRSPQPYDKGPEDSKKKSSMGKVMEMYDDIVYLMYIDGKLAMPTPVEKKEMTKYERLIKNVLPGSDIQFKGTPRHHYSSEELAEGKGAIRKTLAGIVLLGGLLGLENHQAQKMYDQSHQLQQLTQVYMVAKDRGDEQKMKDVKRRISNHKTRIDLGKGDVDFDGRPGNDDIKDIDYINPIQES